MKKREGERRNPWSRRLGERRVANLDVDEDRRKGDRRKLDQRNSSTEKRSNTSEGPSKD